jgi:hypothetical protein
MVIDDAVELIDADGSAATLTQVRERLTAVREAGT